MSLMRWWSGLVVAFALLYAAIRFALHAWNLPGRLKALRRLRRTARARRVSERGFIALADDNFYPVTLGDIALAEKQNARERVQQLKETRAERFELMARLAQLPKDMVFFTQITMEAAEDPEYLEAMRRAHIKGALVGIESVTEEGLKEVYKGFNLAGDALVDRLRAFRRHWWEMMAIALANTSTGIVTFVGFAYAVPWIVQVAGVSKLHALGINLFGDGLRDTLDPRLKV